MRTFDGDDYQARLDEVTRQARDPHGEANFVAALEPGSVLDAGCGTGRVAIELARRGISVVGVDSAESMLATARRLAPHLEWRHADVASMDLGRTFDLVVMAGNVPRFTPPGTTGELVAGCARHLAPGGHLVAGFRLGKAGPAYGRALSLSQYDAAAAAAGLTLVARYATWDRDPFVDGGDYAVSVHQRPTTTP